MEKNMVVVYENGVGVPFLLKPIGNQVMLLSPGLELSRLRVDAINWDNADRDSKDNFESEFCYLCMTGEEVSQNRIFGLLMLTQKCGDLSSAKQTIETLNTMGVSCTYFPVIAEISVLKDKRFGCDDYQYYGECFSNVGIGNLDCLADMLGHSFINIIRTDVIPEINVVIRNSNLDDDEFEHLKKKLLDITEDSGRIYFTFKNQKN